MQRYPYPPYFEDLYVVVLQTSFPDLIMVSLVLVVLNIAKSVTYEKEKRLKVINYWNYLKIQIGYIFTPGSINPNPLDIFIRKSSESTKIN